jgi:internalin A
MNPTTQLPTELWILILKYLNDPFQSIRCATVSQNFYQQIVFSSITSLDKLFQKLGGSKGNSLLYLQSLSLEDIDDDFIQRFVYLNALDLSAVGCFSTVSDKSFKSMKFLTSLNLNYQRKSYSSITGYGIKGLSNLTSLKLQLNNIVTNECIMGLTNLTFLDLRSNHTISNKGISRLMNIKKLSLAENCLIDDEVLKTLTSLTSLDIEKNQLISDNGIKNLTNITDLNLSYNTNITDMGIKGLTKMKILHLKSAGNHPVIGEGLERMTDLTELNLFRNRTITNSGISNLINLTRLDISDSIISQNELKGLTKIIYLESRF